jgi:hypothetical protein
MATKKRAATRKKAATKKSAKRKPAGRKSAARTRVAKKSAKGRAAGRTTTRKTKTKALRARKRVQRVRAVVEEKARQGLDAARGGFERLKQSTVHLVEDVKERLGGSDGAARDELAQRDPDEMR